MHLPARVWLLTAPLLLCHATQASAEPITAVFAVEVTQRYNVLVQQVEPFEAAFSLSMTFDPTAGGTFPELDMRTYGPVTFSPVPLPLSPAAEFPPLREYAFTQHFRAYDGPVFGWRIQSEAFSEASFASGDAAYTRVVELSSLLRFPYYPELSPERFPIHLGSVPGALERSVFLYGGTYNVSGVFLESYTYWGTARLTAVENPAVPEPATLTLVGSSLLLLLGAGRRRARGCASGDGSIRDSAPDPTGR